MGDKDELARTRLAIFEDKACEINADGNKKYIVDYYYKYNNNALLYTIEKERFNGLFTLEGLSDFHFEKNPGKSLLLVVIIKYLTIVHGL